VRPQALSQDTLYTGLPKRSSDFALRRRLKQPGEFAIFAYIFYNWNIALQMKQAVMTMVSG
jgi:hypothetical protein